MLTVPFKAERNLVYAEGPVYERSTVGKNFYAREYDAAMFNQLVIESQMKVLRSLTIREKPGLLAVDALEWGWGRRHRSIKFALRMMRRFEKLIGKTLDGPLARRYLIVENEGIGRLVNIFSILKSKDLLDR